MGRFHCHDHKPRPYSESVYKAIAEESGAEDSDAGLNRLLNIGIGIGLVVLVIMGIVLFCVNKACAETLLPSATTRQDIAIAGIAAVAMLAGVMYIAIRRPE
jgi:nitrate reductase gamma subunit